MKLMLILVIVYGTTMANSEGLAKDCEDCLSRCIQKEGAFDCPNDLRCFTCYKELIEMEEAAIQEQKAEVGKEKNELNDLEGLETSTQVGRMDDKRAAAALASEKTTNVDEMVKNVKKELGEVAFNKVGEELEKRIKTRISLWWLLKKCKAACKKAFLKAVTEGFSGSLSMWFLEHWA